MKNNHAIVGRILVLTTVLITIAYIFSCLLFKSGTILSYRDATHFYYPLFLYLQSCFHAGEIPLWTEYHNLGFPLVANPTTALFYPPTWILALPIPPWLAFNTYIIGHVLLAFGTMYYCVRRWGHSISASVLAGISYSVGGIVLFQYSNLPYLVSASWLPLGIYAVEQAVKTHRWKSICLSGVVLALMTLGGDVQTAYNLGILTLLLTLIVNIRSWYKKESSSWKLLRNSILTLIGIAVTGFLLASVQILPTAELTINSDRSESDNSIRAMENRFSFSVPPWRVLEFAVPEIYGRQFPVYQRWIDAVPGSDIATWVPSLYMGTVPFFLACLSLTFYTRSRSATSQRRVWISWIIALALLASMGRLSIGYLIQSVGFWTGTDYTQNISSGWGGVYWLLMSIFPGYGSFRYPAKWLTVVAMGMSILSAYGWDRLWLDVRFRYRLTVCLGVTAITMIAWYFVSPMILPTITAGLSHTLYGPYQNDAYIRTLGTQTPTSTLQFASALGLIVVCLLLKGYKKSCELRVASEEKSCELRVASDEKSCELRVASCEKKEQNSEENPDKPDNVSPQNDNSETDNNSQLATRNSQLNKSLTTHNFVRFSLLLLIVAELSIYSQRLLTPIPASIYESHIVEYSTPVRRIYRQGNNWLPTRFRETSSVNREEELAIWNRDSLFAYNGLYQHATTMRYGGTFMLKEYAQFLRKGNKLSIATEIPFCEEIMTYNEQTDTIRFWKNKNYGNFEYISPLLQQFPTFSQFVPPFSQLATRNSQLTNIGTIISLISWLTLLFAVFGEKIKIFSKIFKKIPKIRSDPPLNKVKNEE